MSYLRYFRQGQKILLRPLAPAPQPGHEELLTSHLVAQTAEHFDLRLPYGNLPEEQYPFSVGMTFELSSDAIGIGLRMTGKVDQLLASDLVRITLGHDLQALQRRQKPRVDVRVEVRFTRGKGNLRSMRELWHKNVDLLQARTEFANIGGLTPCEVNLSSGGIRFVVKPPATPGDLCLMLLRLPQDPRPLCILAELVWVAKVPATAPMAGMQFLGIAEADRQRLERFVAASPKASSADA